MKRPVQIAGAVLVSLAMLVLGVAWTGTRHPAALPQHASLPGSVSEFPIYWQVEAKPAVLADALKQLEEDRTGLERRAARPLACFVSRNCIRDLEPKATYDAQLNAALSVVRSNSSTKHDREEAWSLLSSKDIGARVGIESADRGSGVFGLYLVVALLILVAGGLALGDRYGWAMVALVIAFFPTGVLALLKFPFAMTIVALLPLGGVALLYAQGIGGGPLPPFFATFEASLARLPTSKRAARIRREIAVGAGLAFVGLAIGAGLFVLAAAMASPVILVAPGLFAFGALRALRGVIATRPA